MMKEADKKQSTRSGRGWLPNITLLFAALGIADAAYLTYEHYQGDTLVCGGIAGCDIVTTSAYATVAGIPIALIGILYYVAVFGLLSIHIIYAKRYLLYVATVLTGSGVLVSGVLVYLQLLVINAICVYCMVSAITSVLLFLLMIAHIISARETADDTALE